MLDLEDAGTGALHKAAELCDTPDGLRLSCYYNEHLKHNEWDRFLDHIEKN